MHGSGTTPKPSPDRNALEQTKFGENPQAALHGLLERVRDLGMPLVSVSAVEPGQADQSDVK